MENRMMKQAAKVQLPSSNQFLRTVRQKSPKNCAQTQKKERSQTEEDFFENSPFRN